MRQNLKDWEQALKPYFQYIKLLGEIPITQFELDGIGNMIRELFSHLSTINGTLRLRKEYPCTLAVYLSAMAAYNTKVGYWDGISEATGVDKQSIRYHHWGDIFLDVLEKNNLPTFSGIGGYKYVSPIRIHGGIPAYSLPDFFSFILWPSVNNSRYKNLATKDIFDTLLKKSTVQQFVDSPVLNFLQSGDDYALDFLERCRKMARLYHQSNDIQEPEKLELPPYVVRIFQKFVDEELETSTGKRYRAPRLFLDPWGPDFYLHLPPEPVEGLLATRDYFWKVEMKQNIEKNLAHTERVRIKRRGYDLETAEVNLPLENPPQHIIVSYCARDRSGSSLDEGNIHTLRRWRLNFLPTDDQPPLLAFDPNNGLIIRWSQTLPAGELWLLYPTDFEISIDGEGEIVEQFPDYFSTWGQWKVEHLDLSKANALQLLKEQKPYKAPIPILSAPPDPVLVGENRLIEDVDPDDVPVFIGEPPWLRIPLRPGRTASSELAHWQVNIKSRWAASPVILNEQFDLKTYESWQKGGPNVVDIPLSAILGNKPCGTYWIVVNGPYSVKAEHLFRVWPDLIIDGLDPYYLPGDGGPRVVNFSMKVPEDCSIIPQAGVEGVSVHKKSSVYNISIDPDVTTADFHLVAPLTGKDPVRFPLSLAIPQLRWALILGLMEKEISWRATTVQSTVGALLQADTPVFYLDLPYIDQLPLIFNILLVNPETKEILQEHTRPKDVHRGQTRWRFPLGEFSDTIRDLDEQPIFEFQLSIHNTDTDDTSLIPIVRLSRTLDIKWVWIAFHDPPTFTLTWEEQKPLRYRRVRIWSMWQPWVKPTELKIPDDAQGELKVDGVGLPPSHFRFQFFTSAPWDPLNPPLDPPDDSLLVETTTPEERLVWIKEQLNNFTQRSFLLHFERACVLDSKGDCETRDQEINWCCQHIKETSPDQIIGFHHWLGKYDPPSQKAVRIQMYRPEKVNELFKVYPNIHPIRDDYLNYFSQTRLIKPDSAATVLDHVSTPEIVMHALITLIEREHSKALAYVFDALESGQLSNQDAGELLSLNLDFSLPNLAEMPDGDTKLRLIERLAKQHPDQQYFVLSDFWIRSSAGWGSIDKIEDDGGNLLQYFNQKKDTPKITATLRPKQYPEKVVIDLQGKTISFLDVKQVYMCIQDNCYYFASEKIDHVRNKHNHASHQGLSPSFGPRSSTFKFFKKVQYSPEPPDDEFE